MKKILFTIAPVAILAMMAFTAGEPLTIGSTMPKENLKMKDISGKMISMKEAAGSNGVMVMFSCNTCPYVVKNQQRTREINEYAEKMKVGVILLNSNEANRNNEDSYEAMKTYAKDQHYKWSYVVDKNNEVADAFDAKRTPEVFLFDKNLKLVYHGAIDDSPSDPTAVSKKHLKEAIKALAEGKEITVKESRSVGCGIKRVK